MYHGLADYNAGKKMKYFEQIIWSLALIFLFFMDTGNAGTSFCLFKAVGFNACAGCGLGHAIHHALHFNFIASINEHILGIPATLGILYNIFKVFISPKKLNNNGSKRHVYDVTGNSTG